MGLFDLDRDTAPDWAAPTRQPPQFRAEPEDLEDVPEIRDPSLVDRIDEQLFGAARRTGFGALSGLGGERKRPDFADARFDTDIPPEEPESVLLEPTTVDPDAVTRDGAEAPEFIRVAERQARWQSSGVRKLLAVAVVGLSVALAGQAAHHFRDSLAARSPGLQAALTAWCDVAGCRIAPPRRIDDITVESTALARDPSSDAFRLSVVLRNKAATTAAVPWIDLTLTDASGQLVARRALSPKDFRSRLDAMPADGEASLQALLSTGSTRVVGYTVEVFYP